MILRATLDSTSKGHASSGSLKTRIIIRTSRRELTV
ncbi:hypothetical protein Zm00014a_041391 [Zea mays]|uniref:Uncharacterized protein n=1 Tax=Zea mays TaxID=4577 RepID=A0A3L6FBV4_MAIZE|nr:hypothetical protein Zm00014a_041391 [Zea mays]